MADKVKLTPPMTDSKTPEWVETFAGDLALNYVDWLGRDKVDPDAEHVLSASISQALLSAYERGRKEGIEEAAKVAEKETEAPAQRNSKSMWVQDIGDRLATAIRQLLEVKG